MKTNIAPIQPWQVKTIYSLGNSLGIVESGSHEDNLHLLINSLSGKESVKSLDFSEANKIIKELKKRTPDNSAAPPKAKTKKHDTTPNGMTEGQQKKVWQLMYQLRACDTKQQEASLGRRLTGIVKRQFQMDGTEREPMRWLDYDQGAQLIEMLKKYVSSAERKMMGRGGCGFTG